MAIIISFLFLLNIYSINALICDLDSLAPLISVNTWTINASESDITAGDSVDIAVNANSGTFLDIVLFVANGPTKIGSWQQRGGFPVVCNNFVVNAQDQSPKSPQTFTWTSPRSLTGPVVVTGALKFSSGWAIYRSDLLVIATDAPPTCNVREAPPQIAQLFQDFEFNINQYCSGPTGSTLKYDVSGLSRNTGLSVINGRLMGRPTADDMQLTQPLQVGITVSTRSGSAVLNVQITVTGSVPQLNCQSFDSCSDAGTFEPYLCDLSTFCPTTPPVTFDVTIPSLIGLSLRNGYRLIGVPQASGTYRVNISFSTGLAKGSQLLNIRVNDRPIPDQSAQLGQRFSLDMRQYFLLGNSLSPKPFWFTNQQIAGTGFVISRTTGLLSGFPTKFDREASPVTFDIQMTFETYRGSKPITIHVNGMGDPPQLREVIPSTTFTPGEPSSLDLSQYWQSPGGFKLTYSVGGLPVSTPLQIDANSGILSGTPTLNDVKFSPMQLTSIVVDAIGNRVTQPFELIVQEQNAGPQTIGDLSQDSTLSNIFVGQPFSLDLGQYFVHPNNFPLTFSITGLPSGTGISLSNGVLAGTPTKNDRKTRLNLQMTATDSKGKTASTLFSFQVLTRPPIVLAIPEEVLVMQEGVASNLDFTPYFLSREGSGLAWRGLTGLPEGTGLSFVPATHKLVGTPNKVDREKSPLELVLSVAEVDGEPSSAVNQTIQVSISEDLDPPPILIQTVPPLFLQQYEYFEYALGVNFRHPDPNKKFTYRLVSGLPVRTGIKLNTTGYVSGFPNARDLAVTPLNVTFQATGSPNKVTTTSMEINIAPNPPLVEGVISEGRSRLGEMFNQNVGTVFSRPFGLPLQFKFGNEGRPPVGSGFSINAVTGIVQGIPKLVDFTASPLALTIEAGNIYDDVVVRAPFILYVGQAINITSMAMPPTTARVGQPFRFEFNPYFKHPNGLPLTFSVTGLPATSLTVQNGALVGTPRENERTTTPLRVLVTAADPNGVKSSAQLLELTIRPATPPTASPTTVSPTTGRPTTHQPTLPTQSPTTPAPTTASPTSSSPTTKSPTTLSPVTSSPTTNSPTTWSPTTVSPTTAQPTTSNPTTPQPTTPFPTHSPTTPFPTRSPTTAIPTTASPTLSPTSAPTQQPTSSPITGVTLSPTISPTRAPTPRRYGNAVLTSPDGSPRPVAAVTFIECLYECVEGFFGECPQEREASWLRDCNLLMVGPCRERCGATSLLPPQAYLELQARLNGPGARLQQQEQRALQLQNMMFQETTANTRAIPSLYVPGSASPPNLPIQGSPYVPKIVPTSRPTPRAPSISVSQIDTQLALLRRIQDLQQERLRLVLKTKQN